MLTICRTCFAALILSVLANPMFGQERPMPRLVEGKFGQALDAAVTPLAFGGDHRYRTPPLTVECWAKLNSKGGFNVLVSSDPKSSAQHWEIYSYAGSGYFAAYLPGYEPAEIVSKKNICDRVWHHLAMTFDGKKVRLFVDGRAVHEQTVKQRAGVKADPGPLCIGMALDGSTRIGCDGLIDEVRISRVVRNIRLPTGVHQVDPQTVGVWRFEGADNILADPAWTPPPQEAGEAWQRATDVDWIDARLRKMDTGPTFQGTLTYPHGESRVLVYKGTAIRIGDKGDAGVLFDRNSLRLVAAWSGGYLQHSDRRFGLLNTPSPAGKLLFSAPPGPGWAGPAGETVSTHPATLPLPSTWGRYEGLHLHGNRVVLQYRVGNTPIYESPWLETIAGQTIITRTLDISPSERVLRLFVGDALAVVPAGKVEEGWLNVPASSEWRTLQIVLGDLAAGQKQSVREALANRKPVSLRTLRTPGSRRWKPLVTRGEVSKDDAAYVVDTLQVPYENPYGALFFLAGHDFLPDGRIAVCTAHGDVWLVSGVDAGLQRLTWQRYATGLYHPLGLRVVDGKVVVLERGQLTRLHDHNGDGEADFYENLCHDWHTGAGEHSYDTCLETDSAGNYYFFKTGDTHLPHGGCLMRVSKEGKKVEVFATGFRHPIGLSVSPTGVVTGADQEGNWMPATRVDIYRQGGFYGDMRAHHRAIPPKIYDPPLLWLPKEVDNSAGGQVWVPHDRFGLPKGQLLHLSYGRCKLFALLIQKVDGLPQAGAVDLGVVFLSGSARGRFHPDDGHLYVTGLNGWQTAARRDGCLQRVRYTGRPLAIPIGLTVMTEGIRLDFAQRLDPQSASDPGRYRIEQWNYRWTADYGSRRWSVRNPDQQGQDRLAVESATLSEDGRSVLLRVKGLTPVMQMRIDYDLLTAESSRLKGAIHNTIHRLATTP